MLLAWPWHGSGPAGGAGGLRTVTEQAAARAAGERRRGLQHWQYTELEAKRARPSRRRAVTVGQDPRIQEPPPAGESEETTAEPRERGRT
jgi:hypothetical protein